MVGDGCCETHSFLVCYCSVQHPQYLHPRSKCRRRPKDGEGKSVRVPRQSSTGIKSILKGDVNERGKIISMRSDLMIIMWWQRGSPGNLGTKCYSFPRSLQSDTDFPSKQGTVSVPWHLDGRHSNNLHNCCLGSSQHWLVWWMLQSRFGLWSSQAFSSNMRGYFQGWDLLGLLLPLHFHLCWGTRNLPAISSTMWKIQSSPCCSMLTPWCIEVNAFGRTQHPSCSPAVLKLSRVCLCWAQLRQLAEGSGASYVCR